MHECFSNECGTLLGFRRGAMTSDGGVGAIAWSGESAPYKDYNYRKERDPGQFANKRLHISGYTVRAFLEDLGNSMLKVLLRKSERGAKPLFGILVASANAVVA